MTKPWSIVLGTIATILWIWWFLYLCTLAP